MADFEFDLERERVLVDGEWLAEGELAARIRTKIEAGDFRVSRLSTALEQLERTVSRLQPVACRLPAEALAAYELLAEREGVPLAQVLRRGLIDHLERLTQPSR